MLPLTTMTAARPTASPLLVAVYSGVATAVAALATALLFQAEMPVLYILAFLLIGVGPVVGYQLATGQLGSDWKPLIWRSAWLYPAHTRLAALADSCGRNDTRAIHWQALYCQFDRHHPRHRDLSDHRYRHGPKSQLDQYRIHFALVFLGRYSWHSHGSLG